MFFVASSNNWAQTGLHKRSDSPEHLHTQMDVDKDPDQKYLDLLPHWICQQEGLKAIST